jgi:hypothetical protein
MRKAIRIVGIVVFVLIVGNLHYYASKAADDTVVRVLSALEIVSVVGLVIFLFRRPRGLARGSNG